MISNWFNQISDEKLSQELLLAGFAKYSHWDFEDAEISVSPQAFEWIKKQVEDEKLHYNPDCLIVWQ